MKKRKNWDSAQVEATLCGASAGLGGTQGTFLLEQTCTDITNSR